MGNNSNFTIRAYKDSTFKPEDGVKSFVAPTNPEDFSIKSEVKYHPPSVLPGLNILKYSGCLPELLTFSLWFNEHENINVDEKVKEFKDVVYHNVNENNDFPNYIRVTWGKTDFQGRLVELDLIYSTFKANGELKSAKATISILEERVKSKSQTTNKEKKPTKPPQTTNKEKKPADIEDNLHSNRYNADLYSVNPGLHPSDSYLTNFFSKDILTADKDVFKKVRHIAYKTNTSFKDGKLKVFGTEVVSLEGFTFKAGSITGVNITGKSSPTDVNILKPSDNIVGRGIGGNTTIINNNIVNNIYNQAPAGAYDGGPDRIYSGGDSSSDSGSSNASNLSGSNNSFSSNRSNSLRASKTSSVSVLTDLPTPKISPWQRLALVAKKACTKGYNATKKAVS